jgi:hypothetical protein
MLALLSRDYTLSLIVVRAGLVLADVCQGRVLLCWGKRHHKYDASGPSQGMWVVRFAWRNCRVEYVYVYVFLLGLSSNMGGGVFDSGCSRRVQHLGLRLCGVCNCVHLCVAVCGCLWLCPAICGCVYPAVRARTVLCRGQATPLWAWHLRQHLRSKGAFLHCAVPCG